MPRCADPRCPVPTWHPTHAKPKAVRWTGDNVDEVTSFAMSLGRNEGFTFTVGSNHGCAKDHDHDGDDCEEDPTVLEVFPTGFGHWTDAQVGDTIDRHGKVTRHAPDPPA